MQQNQDHFPKFVASILQEKHLARVIYTKRGTTCVIKTFENFLSPEQIKKKYGMFVFTHYCIDARKGARYPCMYFNQVRQTLYLCSEECNVKLRVGDTIEKELLLKYILLIRKCGKNLVRIIQQSRRIDAAREKSAKTTIITVVI